MEISYKIKLLLTVLVAVLFSLILILFAFITPIKTGMEPIKVIPKTKLDKIRKSMEGK